jgi:hypothetical protein
MNQRVRNVLICTAAVSLLAFTSIQSGKYFEISKNIEIFTNRVAILRRSLGIDAPAARGVRLIA